MTNALVLSEAPSEMIAPSPRMGTALIPQTYDDMFRLSKAMAASGMFAVKNPEQAMVVLMTGLELGFSPAQAFRGIHVINNKPTLSADMMVAICKNRPDLCLFFRVVESTDDSATYETQRFGDPAPTQNTFTMADAKRAGLLTNPTWQKYPAPLLRARASSGLARMVYSDLTLGLYTPEEAKEIRPEPVNVTPPRSQTATPAQAAAAYQSNSQGDAPNSEDLLRVQRIEKRDALIGLLKALPDDERNAWLDRFESKYGLRDVRHFSLPQYDEAIEAVQAKNWAHEAEFQEKTNPTVPEEEDPFAPVVAALIDVPVAVDGKKGHGAS